MKILSLLTVLILFASSLSANELPVKFFVGWSYHHQDDEIHDGSEMWAIHHTGATYTLTKRTIKLDNFYSPLRDDQTEQSGRTLVASDRDSAIIHFAGIDSLKEGKLFFKTIKQALVKTFPSIPSPLDTSVSFDFNGEVYAFLAKIDDNLDLYVYLVSDNNKQLLCSYSKVVDAMVSLDWIADIDRDEKPDLLIATSGHYSYVNYRLFLSSFAGKDQFVNEVGIFTAGD